MDFSADSSPMRVLASHEQPFLQPTEGAPAPSRFRRMAAVAAPSGRTEIQGKQGSGADCTKF